MTAIPTFDAEIEAMVNRIEARRLNTHWTIEEELLEVQFAAAAPDDQFDAWQDFLDREADRGGA